jgi:exonuclease SbcD
VKILHTADWHLGRSLGQHDLLPLQAAAIREIIKIAGHEKPDAIVIAGDLYDRSVPSEDAMAAFEEAIVGLRQVAPVLAIAGNHDGAGRVGHFAGMLGSAGIHFSSRDFGSIRFVSLRDQHGEVRFHLMPFAMPAEVRQAIRDHSPDRDTAEMASHHAATAARLAPIDRSSGARHVLVGHLFTQSDHGAEESESERDISVGGSSVVSPSLFQGFHYVALGHLHKPHDVVPGRIRYAGSVGRYSFSEEMHEKSVSLVELDAAGATHVREIPILQARGMRTIEGDFHDVLRDAADHSDGRSAFIRIRLTDPVPQYEAFRRLSHHYPRRLSHHYPNLVEVSYLRSGVAAGNSPAPDRPERRDPMAMVRAYCEDRMGDQHLSEDAMKLAGQLMEEARDARAEEAVQ